MAVGSDAGGCCRFPPSLRGALVSDEAIHSSLVAFWIFGEPVIGRAFARPVACNDVTPPSCLRRDWRAGAGFRWCPSDVLPASPIPGRTPPSCPDAPSPPGHVGG